MSKKVKNSYSITTPSINDQSKLNKSAVDKLIEAHNGDDSLDEGMKEIKKGKSGFLDNIPSFVKALFIKWWFVGATVFFFLWGLGNYITSNADKIFIFGLATGLVTDLLTNNLLRLLEKEENEYEFYSMIYSKKLWALFVNVLYGFLVTMLVVYTYNFANDLIIRLNPEKYDATSVPIGVEPLLYSLVFLIYDMALIMIKNLIVKLIKRFKTQKEA